MKQKLMSISHMFTKDISQILTHKKRGGIGKDTFTYQNAKLV